MGNEIKTSKRPGFLLWQAGFMEPEGGLGAGRVVPEPASFLQMVAALVCMARGWCKTDDFLYMF